MIVIYMVGGDVVGLNSDMPIPPKGSVVVVGGKWLEVYEVKYFMDPIEDGVVPPHALGPIHTVHVGMRPISREASGGTEAKT